MEVKLLKMVDQRWRDMQPGTHGGVRNAYEVLKYKHHGDLNVERILLK
jgi:hypothetical protein